ncbi:tetratricopeptide repeat protein [Rhodohalobacter mucosus]|uniref:Uncharacterized protein n=1 Tax=Rhodohalobacter mucosus TaxID=2079485 RepID=A0A316TYY7_9BACT|nr:tetratricopeptide repeat protein [Rhodohalobacter mucosus]PWN08122.1 hypothetical protein DDZ15_00350 [Rhodohalobacter mucosus]
MFLAGCAGPIKQSWNNFTAYYNTFYNAKSYFSEGEELNRSQAALINPQELIQVFPGPSDAGAEQFDEAISRAASILRKHEQSQYVIPSILMIGKSYFYKSEFFSALEKFREAGTIAENREYAESVVWEARVLYEMNNIEGGLLVTSQALNSADQWDLDQRGELYAINGQLHAAQQDWERASLSLLRAEELMESQAMLARVYFLHGQVLENLENLVQARAAFGFAAEIKSDYDVEFHAMKKQADISRRIGDYDDALSLYRRLERDDKFSDQRVRMRYEIARTHQIMGDADLAFNQYSSILNHPFDVADNVTLARTYFGLGELFRDEQDNFTMAAAYFDSAASVNVADERISLEFDASELAESFSDYAFLKQELAMRDSLLKLASLNPAELDSVLADIRQELEEEAQQDRERITQPNTIALTDAGQAPEAAGSAEFGFLNHMNRDRLREASLQFQAVWGDRPLEDNWRRRDAVTGSRFDRAESPALSDQGENPVSQNMLMAQFAPDLSAIPFEEDAQVEMKLEMEELTYRLANLFLLSLNMPDSARFYYEDQLRSGLNSSVSPRSLFSLIDLDLQEGNERAAREKAGRIIENFPDSPFTEEVRERLGYPGGEELSDAPAKSDKYTLAAQLLEMERTDTLMSPIEKADLFRQLGETSDDANQKELLFYESARIYLEEAVRMSEDKEAISSWLADSSGRGADVSGLQDAQADSVAADSPTSTVNQDEYPFEGAYWDSTRSMLEKVLSLNQTGRIATEADALFEVLQKPGPAAEDTVRTMAFPPDRYPTDPGPDMNNCLEAGLELNVEGGMTGFMSRVRFPDWAYGSGLKTEITYRLTVNAEGNVVEYEQISEISRSGIPEAVEASIEEELEFKPLTGIDSYSCELRFPIDL